MVDYSRVPVGHYYIPTLLTGTTSSLSSVGIEDSALTALARDANLLTTSLETSQNDQSVLTTGKKGEDCLIHNYSTSNALCNLKRSDSESPASSNDHYGDDC